MYELSFFSVTPVFSPARASRRKRFFCVYLFLDRMLKKYFIFSVCLSFFLSAQAERVTREKAIEVARQIIYLNKADFKGTTPSVKNMTYEGQDVFYVVQFVPEGWALIAADDMSAPVLGYSTTGVYQTDRQPEHLQDWLEGYCKQIVYNATIQGARHPRWELPTVTTRASAEKVDPLISVNWNQGRPYNQFCPSDNNGTAVVGCVAVAMAQAMSVSRYPPRPVGQYGYAHATYGYISVNYDAEAAYNWSAIMSGADNRSEVARLLYHCAVSVSMDFGVSGSGTQNSYVVSALVRNFQYPAASLKYYSRSNYSGDWAQLILNELYAGRAVSYNGADLKKGYGHAFNLDGYDGSFFHVNWGWGGANNGYFPIDGLRDNTMGMDYTAQQGVIVGIRPPTDAPSNITLSSSQVKEKQPAGTIIGNITVESEAINPVYEFSIRGPYSPILHTYLDAPFEIVNGQLQTTEPLDKKDGDRIIDITVRNTNNNRSLTQSFTINVLSSTATNLSLASVVSFMYDRNTKEITLSSKENVSYTVYSGEDNVVSSGYLQANTSVTLQTDEWEAENLIQFSNASESKEIKIVIDK